MVRLPAWPPTLVLPATPQAARGRVPTRPRESMDWLNSTFGALAAAPSWLCWLVTLVALLAPLHLGVRLWQFTAVVAALLWTLGAPVWVWILAVGPLGFLLLVPLRRALLTARILRALRAGGFLPQISETERTAI